MNSPMTRRRLLAATACTTCSMLANPIADAATLLVRPSVAAPGMVRRMTSWNEVGSLRCWVECRAETAEAVLFDMQSVFSERAVVHHLDPHDMELLFRHHTSPDIPLVRAGCATEENLEKALAMACNDAGQCRLYKPRTNRYSGLVVVSASDNSEFLASIKRVSAWLNARLAHSHYLGIQYVVDPSLTSDSKRVTVVVAA